MSITKISQCKSLRAMAVYCTTPKKEQTKERVAYMHCDLGSVNQFLHYAENTIKAHQRKIQGYTLLQSFPSHEFHVDNQNHIALVNLLGQQLAQALYPHSPCLVITHADSDGQCVHNHILVVNHDLETDGCIKDNRHFRYVKEANDTLMRKHGYEVCKENSTKQSQGEYWSNKRTHWLDQLKDSLDKVLSHATTMQEFHDCLKAEGIDSTLCRANGTLKERFTYQVMDPDGKLHKKRSDKLGVDYTREAIERTLASNRHKRSLEAQKPIMSMSDWIEAQNRLQEELKENEIPTTYTTDIVKPISQQSKKEEQENAPEEELTMDRTELLLREEERMKKQRRINALNQQIESCRKRIKDYRDRLNKLANKKEFDISDEAEQTRLTKMLNEESMLLIKYEKELTSLSSSNKVQLNTSLVSTPSPTKSNDFSK